MNEDIAEPTKPILPSKQENKGQEIVARIYTRDPNAGGSFSSITGQPGCGKTSVMLGLTKYILKHNKDELVYWSSSYGSPLQFFPLGMENIHILCKSGMNIQFWDRLKGCEMDLKHDTFTDFEDLYKKSIKGKLNCVFFGDRLLWMDFLEFLMSKHGWHTAFIDEISEICPSFTAGKVFKKIGWFANHVLGQTRKCWLTVVTNTQATGDTDHRIRKKLNIRILMEGSRASKETRVFQKAIDNLKVDHIHGSYAYVTTAGVFGVVRFTDVFTPIPNFSVEARTTFRSDIFGINDTEQKPGKTDSGGCITEPDTINEFREWKNKRDSLSDVT